MAIQFGNLLRTAGYRAAAFAAVWLLLVGLANARIESLPPVSDDAAMLASPQASLLDVSPADGETPHVGKASAATVFSGLVDVLKGGQNDDDQTEFAAQPPTDGVFPPDDTWTWQLLPGSLIYHSYLAGAKEPRIGGFFAYDKHHGWMWDITLGGRVGLLRYGSQGGLRPQGWQFDLEGAAFPRLDLMNNEDLMAADFRAGAPLTYGRGNYQAKLAVYHLSSHAGDEYMLTNPSFVRINYSRNVLVWGHSYYWRDWRVYGEAGWAFDTDVGEPWEFQTGLEYSPLCVSAPFMALNLHSRQEVAFGGNVVLQAGWQWRNMARLFRIGFEYYDGKSDQFEFYSQTEQKVGVGLWYDF